MKIIVVIWILIVTVGAVFGYYAVLDNDPPVSSVLERLPDNLRQRLQEKADTLYLPFSSDWRMRID